MLKINQLTILSLFMMALHAELLFKVTNIKDGASIELPKKEKPIGDPVGEDSFFTTPISLTVGDGVGGCKFSSSFVARYLTSNATYRTLLKRHIEMSQKNQRYSLSDFTKNHQEEITEDLQRYSKSIEEIFDRVEPFPVTEKEKGVFLKGLLPVSTTFISSSLHYDAEQKSYVLHTLQKGDSLGVVFRKMVTSTDTKTGESTYHYLPVFMTNAQQSAGFNAPDQFESSRSEYNPSQDDAVLFRVQEHDIVLLGSDGLFDNVSISFLTFALNLYIQASTNSRMFKSKPIDVLDLAFDIFSDTLLENKIEIEKYIKKETEARNRKINDPSSNSKPRDTLSNTVISPKQYEAKDWLTKHLMRPLSKEDPKIQIRLDSRPKLDAGQGIMPANNRPREVRPNQNFVQGKNFPSVYSGLNAHQTSVKELMGQKLQINQNRHYYPMPAGQNGGQGYIHPPQKLNPGVQPLAHDSESNTQQDIIAKFREKRRNLKVKDSENQLAGNEARDLSTNPEKHVYPMNVRVVQNVYRPSQKASNENFSNVQGEYQYQGDYNTEAFHKRTFMPNQQKETSSSLDIHKMLKSHDFGNKKIDEAVNRLTRISEEIKQRVDEVSADQKLVFEEENITPVTALKKSWIKVEESPTNNRELGSSKLRPKTPSLAKIFKKSPSPFKEHKLIQNKVIQTLDTPLETNLNAAKTILEEAPHSNSKESANQKQGLRKSIRRHGGFDRKISLVNSIKFNADGNKDANEIVKRKIPQQTAELLDNFNQIKDLTPNTRLKIFGTHKNGEQRKKNERILIGLTDVKDDDDLKEKLKIDSEVIYQRNYFAVNALKLIKEPSDTFTEKLIDDDVAKALRNDFSLSSYQIDAFVKDFNAAEFSSVLASMTKRIALKRTYYPSPFYMQAKIMLPSNFVIPAVGKDDDITVTVGLIINSNFSSIEIKDYLEELTTENKSWTTQVKSALQYFKPFMHKKYLEAEQRQQQQKEKRESQNII